MALPSALKRRTKPIEPVWLAVGVDPGASGAVALIGARGYADGRVVDTKDPYAIEAAMAELFAAADDLYSTISTTFVRRVYIEDVHSMPGEGHVGVFSFGQAKGVPRGWFAARQYVLDLVAPQTWQAHFFGKTLVGVDKATRKDVILEAARVRWPKASLARAKDEAVAAALYIASCGMTEKPW